MIPRIAGNCFWLARYLERAENNARLLRMAERHGHLPEARGDEVGLLSTALEVGGTLDDYEARIGAVERAAVFRFMVLDRENPSGVVSCWKRARDNARTAKHLLTDFYWESINATWLEAQALDEAALERLGVEGVVGWSIERCRLVRGAAEDLLRDTVPHVLALGEAVERADFTARILAEMLPALLADGAAPPPIGSPASRRWKSLLAGLGLTETWRREPGSSLDPVGVLRIVFQHPTSPHGLLVNAGRMSQAIKGFAGERPSHSRELAEALEAHVRALDVERVAASDVKDFMDELTRRTNAIGVAAYEDHFT